MSYKWAKSDDVVTYYLYRLREDRSVRAQSPRLETTLALLLKLDPGVMLMRIRYFQHLDGKGGLEGVPAQLERIFWTYKGRSMEQLGKAVEKIIKRRSPPKRP